MSRHACSLVLALGLQWAAASASASEATVTLAFTEGAPPAVAGTLRLVDTPFGLAIYPALKGLPAGLHGFHVHENASCAAGLKDGVPVPGLAAGGHFDPLHSGRHGEPWGDGHLGDLPPLYVAVDGTATTPSFAPRLHVADVRHHAIMVHAGGDNHSDHPAPFGGGGARMACGVPGD